MNVNDIKVEIAKSLFETNDKELLNQVKNILNNHETDLWDELNEEQKESIRISQQQYKEGKVLSHEKVMEKHKKWLTK